MARFFAETPIPTLYEWFADQAEASSPLWARVSRWIAAHSDLHERLDNLPGEARQPNRLLAALRFHDAPLEPGPVLIGWMDEHWEEVRSTIIARPTQTNEPGRLGVLAPALAMLPQPIALLELGAAAGLCLLPDLLDVKPERIEGTPPVGAERLSIAQRLGVDRNPLCPRDPDACRWLQALVWPGEETRQQRLAHALELARTHEPEVRRADLAAQPQRIIPALVAELCERAPQASVVVQHSVTLGYLDKAQRRRVVDAIRGSGAHWLFLEDERVFPTITSRAKERGDRPQWGPMLLALDCVPLAWSHPHGREVRWLSR